MEGFFEAATYLIITHRNTWWIITKVKPTFQEVTNAPAHPKNHHPKTKRFNWLSTRPMIQYITLTSKKVVRIKLMFYPQGF
jgi:hypothetical protein